MLHGATTAEEVRVLRAIRHVEEDEKGQQPPPQRSVLAVQVVRLRELEELATDRSAGSATEGTGVNLHCAEAAGAELQALIARAPR